jgi:hypothetical protein
MKGRIQIKKLFLVVAVLSLLSLAASAAAEPQKQQADRWKILQDTQDLNQFTNLMTSSDASGAPGLAVALAQHVKKAQGDIQDLYAIDTTTLSDSDLRAYVATLENFCYALCAAGAATRTLGYTDAYNTCAATYGTFFSYVQYQSNLDAKLSETGSDMKDPRSIFMH